MKTSRWVLIFTLLIGAQTALAQTEQTTGSVARPTAAEQKIGPATISGSGDISGNAQELEIGAEFRDFSRSPLSASLKGRISQERFLPYDLQHWGAEGGLGWVLSPTSDLVATYRYDHENVFNTSRDGDPSYKSVAGRSAVTALGLSFKHDSRDDSFYPTKGYKVQAGGEIASKWFGGNYNFGRLESNFAMYVSPFSDGSHGPFLEDITFAEHFRAGWVEDFGGVDEVPFFERYFAGGSSTVRGSRSRWLTPRGTDNQFIGGEILLLNNIEARMPIFKGTFQKKLSAALFFDVGRAYRRFSEIGDFGYGIGAGLRYVVHFWKIDGIVRADYGINLNPEGDNSTTNAHITFGTPF